MLLKEERLTKEEKITKKGYGTFLQMKFNHDRQKAITVHIKRDIMNNSGQNRQSWSVN